MSAARKPYLYSKDNKLPPQVEGPFQMFVDGVSLTEFNSDVMKEYFQAVRVDFCADSFAITRLLN